MLQLAEFCNVVVASLEHAMAPSTGLKDADNRPFHVDLNDFRRRLFADPQDGAGKNAETSSFLYGLLS
jgi:hypothetical protein